MFRELLQLCAEKNRGSRIALHTYQKTVKSSEIERPKDLLRHPWTWFIQQYKKPDQRGSLKEMVSKLQPTYNLLHQLGVPYSSTRYIN